VLINRKGGAYMKKACCFKGSPSDIVDLTSRLGRGLEKASCASDNEGFHSISPHRLVWFVCSSVDFIRKRGPAAWLHTTMLGYSRNFTTNLTCDSQCFRE